MVQTPKFLMGDTVEAIITSVECFVHLSSSAFVAVKDFPRLKQLPDTTTFFCSLFDLETILNLQDVICVGSSCVAVMAEGARIALDEINHFSVHHR